MNFLHSGLKTYIFQYAAILKQHVRRWLKSGDGHRANTPTEFAEALVSLSGVSNVLVMQGSIEKAQKMPKKRQMPGVSMYNDFEFTDHGILGNILLNFDEFFCRKFKNSF